jgi:DHA1 family bicyclomycin/chloramphenicol resistance-like MFS transporter
VPLSSPPEGNGRLPVPAVLVLALLAAISPLATGMYLPAFPLMADDLSTDAATLQLTMTTFLAGLAAGQLVIGPLSDRRGRRGPLLTGAAVCVLASAVCTVAPGIGVLIAARFLQGFAGAAGIVLGRAIIADTVTGTVAARTFSWLMTLGAVAPVVAPLLGGALLRPLGWRGVFGALTVIAVVMLVGAFVVLPESLPLSRRGAGAPLRGAGGLLADRQYLAHAVVLVFSYGMLIAYVSASPFVLQEVFGLSPGWYAVAFAANAGGLTLASLTNARLVGRFGARRLLRIGLAWELGSAGVLLVLTVAGSLTLVPVLVLFWSCVASLGLVMGNATSLALAGTARSAGTGSALLGAGQFALAAAVAPLVGIGGERTAVPMAVTMTVSAGIAVAGALLTRRVRSPGRPGRRGEPAPVRPDGQGRPARSGSSGG